ncbi:MAG: AI-2E family transporter [Clostridiales bacterium]|nr:AI-2E family transporter [Clostridiales bacterium]
MKRDQYHNHISWGLTVFAVFAATVMLIFAIIRFDELKGLFGQIASILAPITYGAVMAYLLTPVYNQTRAVCLRWSEKLFRDPSHRGKLGAVVATIVSVVLLFAVLAGLISMMIPQLIKSVVGIVETLPSNFARLQLWLEQLLADNPDLEPIILKYYDEAWSSFQSWLTNDVIPNITRVYTIITSVSTSVFSALNVLKNFLIGIIVMVYLLNMKEKLMTQAKMILYGVCSVRVANKILEEARFAHHVFGGFIIGKLIDSLIIGIICFVLMGFMNMPYVLLISVVIGVTNVIPFFGPFIGAIPSALLILLEDPSKFIWFVGFILLLQQFDGNILGPKILGDSTGVSSFWVLFSILVFGGMFGFVGMIIAVPTFAVIYKLVTELVTWLLHRRKLSADIARYQDLDYIDQEDHSYMKKQENS